MPKPCITVYYTTTILVSKEISNISLFFILFYPYIHLPDSKESEVGANTWGKQS